MNLYKEELDHYSDDENFIYFRYQCIFVNPSLEGTSISFLCPVLMKNKDDLEKPLTFSFFWSFSFTTFSEKVLCCVCCRFLWNPVPSLFSRIFWFHIIREANSTHKKIQQHTVRIPKLWSGGDHSRLEILGVFAGPLGRGDAPSNQLT